MTALRTFAIAGLEVVVRSQTNQGLDGLSPWYEWYPGTDSSPDLILDIRYEPTRVTSLRDAQSPAFRRSRDSDTGDVLLHRSDADGRIILPRDEGSPVRAAFEIGTPWGIEAAIRIAMSIALPRHGGMIMHASAVTDGTRAWIFSGVSGAGKSTIANLLLEANPTWTKLSDELLILREADDGWNIHVAPFKGDQGLPHGTVSGVSGLFLIAHAPSHLVQRIDARRAVGAVLRNTLAYVAEPATAQRLLDAATRFATSVPCSSLAFAKDPSVAQVLVVT